MKNKILSLLLLFIFIHAHSAFGQTVAVLAENDDFIFRASDEAFVYQEMIMEDPAADGTAESDPFEAWVPIDTDTGSQSDYTILTSNTALPRINAAKTPFAHLRFLVEVTNNTGDTYTLQAGASNGTNYIAFSISPTVITGDQFQIDIDFNNLCVAVGTTCTSTFLSAVDGVRESAFTFYIYARKTITTIGNTVDPSSSMSGGVYYKINLSDKIPTGNLTLSSLILGDKNLAFNFSGGASLGNMQDAILHQLLLYDYSSGTAQTPQAVQVAATGAIYSLENPNREGAVSAQNLTNGTQYNFALALVNRYQFASALSNSIVGTPIEIETLLKKNACYLVTAGFQKQHYILDYFRKFRDRVLLKSSLGSWFVQFYYDTAPAYAPVIYNSKWLSALVRGASYLIFYVMKVYPVLIFLLLMLAGIRYKRRLLKQGIKN